jgi:Na+/melibiose symporter-like transporter
LAGRNNGGMSNTEVRRVLTAEGISNFGSMLSRLAIPWLAALSLQATPAQMALLLVADVVSAALGALLLGAQVDRCGKRVMMLVCDAGRALVLGLLALAAWHGWLDMTALVVAAALSGALSMSFEMARSAWMAQRVALADLPRRNAQLSVVGSLSETAAFAIGGWLYQGLGAVWSLAVDAVSYLLSACFLRGVREPEPAAAAAPASAAAAARTWGQRLRAALAQAQQGLRAVAERPRLRALAAIEALGSLSFALTGTVYTLFVTRELMLPTSDLGMIAAMGGLGAVLGATFAPRLGRSLGAGRTMTLGLTAFAVGIACIPMAQGAAWMMAAWLVAHQVIGDAGHTLHDVHDRTLRQTAVPVELLARADAGVRTAGQLALLAGAALGGWLGGAWGYRPVLWLAVACAAGAAWVAAARLGDWWAAAAAPHGGQGPGPS